MLEEAVSVGFEGISQDDGFFPPGPHGNDGKGNSRHFLYGFEVASRIFREIRKAVNTPQVFLPAGKLLGNGLTRLEGVQFRGHRLESLRAALVGVGDFQPGNAA